MYPVAQVQEPYSVVGYLAARVPVVDLLRLEHPNPDCLEDGKSRTGKSESTSDDAADRENHSTREGNEAGGDTGRSHTKDGQSWTPWDICDG